MNFFPLTIACLLCFNLLSHAGQTVDYTVDDLTYEGYYASPDQPKALILLLHDWDGLTAYEVKRSDMLVDAGYAVFAADLFGKGIRPTENKDKRQHTGELYQDREKLRALMQGALSAAQAEGADTQNLVVMGYCFGGAAALEYARAGFDAQGIVTFHGGLESPEGQNYENTKGKVLIFHGSADSHITLQHFAQLASELESANIPHEMVTYGGAPHSFTVFESGAYHEESDTLSWRQFLNFLNDTFSTPIKN